MHDLKYGILIERLPYAFICHRGTKNITQNVGNAVRLLKFKVSPFLVLPIDYSHICQEWGFWDKVDSKDEDALLFLLIPSCFSQPLKTVNSKVIVAIKTTSASILKIQIQLFTVVIWGIDRRQIIHQVVLKLEQWPTYFIVSRV